MVFLSVALLFILTARLHLSLTRFFDPDEFAHLHWTYLITQGKLPYRDFFFYLAPLFQWLIAPLFFLPHGTYILLLARLVMFLLFCLNLLLIKKITLQVTNNPMTALFSTLIFTTFPMTFDKTIDVRPDMLMLVFFLFGVNQALTKPLTPARLLVIGAAFGASIVALMKAILLVPAGLLLVLLSLPKDERPRGTAIVLAGLSIPVLGFWALLARGGLTTLAWEAYTHTAFVVNAGKQTFSPLLALSPWPLVYVDRGGVSLPWLVNTVVWILALLGFLPMWQRNRVFAIFLSFYFASVALFLFLFPAPYLQYFLPASVFTSMLAAVILEAMRGEQFINALKICRTMIGGFVGGKSSLRENRVSLLQPKTRLPSVVKKFVPRSVAYAAPILLLSFWQQYTIRIKPENQNTEQLAVIDTVLRITKPTDTVYDMVGSYVFRPDGYFICCHPYAEFVDKLKTKPPSLKDSLIKSNTKYIVLDRTGVSLWLPKPEDLSYILATYVPSRYPKIYVRR